MTPVSRRWYATVVAVVAEVVGVVAAEVAAAVVASPVAVAAVVVTEAVAMEAPEATLLLLAAAAGGRLFAHPLSFLCTCLSGLMRHSSHGVTEGVCVRIFRGAAGKKDCVFLFLLMMALVDSLWLTVGLTTH